MEVSHARAAAVTTNDEAGGQAGVTEISRMLQAIARDRTRISAAYRYETGPANELPAPWAEAEGEAVRAAARARCPRLRRHRLRVAPGEQEPRDGEQDGCPEAEDPESLPWREQAGGLLADIRDEDPGVGRHVGIDVLAGGARD